MNSGARWWWGMVPLVAILVLAVGGQIGCVTANTTSEGDRQIEDQTRKATAQAVEAIEKVRATSTSGSENWTMLGVALTALEDVELGTAQLQAAHGPPKEPKPYSPENMKAAIDQSKKDHAGIPWGSVALGAAGVATGLLGAWLGMPWLSSLFPSRTGIVGMAKDAGIQIVTAIRKQAEEGGSITAKDVLKIAKEYGASAPKGVLEVLQKGATAYEDKLGYTPAVKLEPIIPSPAPAPAPAT
jgi:hypothetical protein